MYHTLQQAENETQVVSQNPFSKVGATIKLFALYLFWNWGLLILFFTGWCIACYLYFDAVTHATLPPNLQDDIMNTPHAGKVIFIIVAGRKVAIRCKCYIDSLKVKYIKGN